MFFEQSLMCLKSNVIWCWGFQTKNTCRPCLCSVTGVLKYVFTFFITLTCCAFYAAQVCYVETIANTFSTSTSSCMCLYTSITHISSTVDCDFSYTDIYWDSGHQQLEHYVHTKNKTNLKNHRWGTRFSVSKWHKLNGMTLIIYSILSALRENIF